MLMNTQHLRTLYCWSFIFLSVLVLTRTLSSLTADYFDPRLLILAVLVGIGSSHVAVQIPKVNATISVADAFVYLGMLLFGTEAGVLLGFADAAHVLFSTRRTLTTRLFAAAGLMVPAYLAGLAVESIFGALEVLPRTLGAARYGAALLLLALVHYFCNTMIVAGSQALKLAQPFWQTWRDHYLWASLTYLFGAAVAGVAARYAVAHGFFTVLLAVPVVALLYVTYRQYLSNVETSARQAEQAERHAAELADANDALRRSEHDYRALFERAHDAILIVTPDREIVLDANERACRMYGYERDEFIGSSLETVTRDVARGKEFVARVMTSGEGLGFETVQLRRDDSEMHLEINAAAGTYQGARSMQVIARDITERLTLEAQLRQAQKMESIGTLAGGVAHDFNNLLCAILGNCAFLLDALPADADEREDAEEIKRCAERAADLTRQLLAFSRKQMLQPKVLDLAELLGDTGKMLRRLIGEHINLSFDFASDLMRIEADPGQIDQVVMNLAVNARDAMPGGGRLRIEAHNEFVYGERAVANDLAPGAYVRLTITDSGEGIPPEVQTRIFEPFFTTKEQGKGTGLGLSTVYGIVKQSGGTLKLDSEVGRGTTFHIYLPGIDEEEDLMMKVTGYALAHGTETVLVVEDDPSVARIAKRVLDRCGYRTLPAADGREALRVAAEFDGEIHLLLTDVVMPEVSGRDLAESLRAPRPGMRVLYMSGYTDDDVLRSSVASDQAPFLQKPFPPDVLVAKVREVLDAPAGSTVTVAAGHSAE